MKRLIPRSAGLVRGQEVSDEFQFLYDWVVNQEFDALYAAKRIIQDNPDCVYSGPVYRVYTINDQKMLNAAVAAYNSGEISGEYKSSSETGPGYAIIKKEDVDIIVNEIIGMKDLRRYRSFAKDMDGIIGYVTSGVGDDGESFWLTTSNISNGLDIQKLLDKCKNEDPSIKFFDPTKDLNNRMNEHEILAIPSTSQELVGYIDGSNVQRQYEIGINLNTSKGSFYPGIKTS